MKTAAMSSLSLQTHLLSLQPKPAAVAVDPRGFKTALQSFVQFLITHEVQATLWLKLPKDDAWWQDIWQYGQQAAGCTIYTLGEQTGNPPESLAASLRPIPIEQTAELKREYLCLAVADNFVGVLLAARVAPGTPTPDKRTLNLYSAIAPRSVVAVSHSIKAILDHNLPAESPPEPDTSLEANAEMAKATDEGSESEDDMSLTGRIQPHSARAIAGEAALSQWNRCFPESLASQTTMPLAENFLTWQLQFQEDLRSQLNEYRSVSKNKKANTLTPALHSISAGFLDKARQELHSPLTTIKTALTLLGSPTLKIAQRQRYLEMITAECEHQKSLINDIVQLLQAQTTRRETAQGLILSDLIPGIVSIYQPIAEERGVMLAYTVPAELATVLGVEAELKQVLIQLINNGIQITPTGGRVWVAATPYNNNFVSLTVQDSGCGIAKENIERMFDAFVQTASSHSAQKESKKGTGLGLTLVRHLIQRMGGSISVESVPNSGTTFQILLPIHTAPKKASSDRASSDRTSSDGASSDGASSDSSVRTDESAKASHRNKQLSGNQALSPAAAATNQAPRVASHPDFLTRSH